MSGGNDIYDNSWRKECMDKIKDITWKKIEDGYLITTTVDYKGNHIIVKKKIDDSKDLQEFIFDELLKEKKIPTSVFIG